MIGYDGQPEPMICSKRFPENGVSLVDLLISPLGHVIIARPTSYRLSTSAPDFIQQPGAESAISEAFWSYLMTALNYQVSPAFIYVCHTYSCHCNGYSCAVDSGMHL